VPRPLTTRVYGTRDNSAEDRRLSWPEWLVIYQKGIRANGSARSQHPVLSGVETSSKLVDASDRGGWVAAAATAGGRRRRRQMIAIKLTDDVTAVCVSSFRAAAACLTHAQLSRVHDVTVTPAGRPADNGDILPPAVYSGWSVLGSCRAPRPSSSQNYTLCALVVGRFVGRLFSPAPSSSPRQRSVYITSLVSSHTKT